MWPSTPIPTRAWRCYDSYNTAGLGDRYQVGRHEPGGARVGGPDRHRRPGAGTRGLLARRPHPDLPAIYAAPAADFHDITSGSNGSYSAGPGYDEVTGLGTPMADLLLPELAAYPASVKISCPTHSIRLRFRLRHRIRR